VYSFGIYVSGMLCVVLDMLELFFVCVQEIQNVCVQSTVSNYYTVLHCLHCLVIRAVC